MAQAATSYEPARQALQNQINSINGQLQTTQDNINKQYAQQQQTLERNRDSAAETASLQAAGSGGSFGGRANIANRKYYEQTFVPAQQQLQTNQAQALSEAQQQANSNRQSLESQLANLAVQQSQYAQQLYEAEQARELQRAQIAAQNAANSTNSYLAQALSGQNNSNSNQNIYENVGTGSNWQFRNALTGNAVKLGTVIGAMNGDFNTNLRGQLQRMADSGDAGAKQVLNDMNYGAKFRQNTGKNFQSTGNSLLDRLGLAVA